MYSIRKAFVVHALGLGLMLAWVGPAQADFGEAFDVSTGGGGKSDTDVAVDPDGNAYFVWDDRGGADTAIHARVRSSDGTLGSVLVLSALDAGDPHVAVDPSGNAYFVWSRSLPDHSTLIEARRLAAGGALGSVMTVAASDETHSVNSPEVAADANGDVHFAWIQHGLLVTQPTVAQSRHLQAGGTFGAIQTLSSGATPEHSAGNAVVDASPGGVADFVWTQYDGATHTTTTRRRAADGTLGAIQTLSTGQSGGDADLVVDSSGNTHFVWADTSGGVTAHTRRKAADGTLGATQDLAAGCQDVDVDIDAAGNAYFTWVCGVNTVQTRPRATDGTLGAVQDLGQGSEPQVAVDAAGNAEFLWRPLSTGLPVQARERSAAGVLGAVQDLSTPSAGNHSLASNDQGTHAASWVESASGGGGLVARGAIADTRPDTDGDGLFDSWEIDGIDTNDDGTPELDLPAMGSDPDHKDIFLELDVMPGHELSQAAIDHVIAAFANAPVSNPDTSTGIDLHVDNGPTSVMTPALQTWGGLSDQDSISHDPVLGTVTGGNYDWGEFDTIKAANFSTDREPAFHYVVSGHSHGSASNDSSGISRGIKASDLLVTLGPASEPGEGSGTVEQQAGTLMHELGHNLALRHGGTENRNYKSNYLSIMNYSFQFRWLQQANGTTVLDYSRFQIPLDENALNESTGFGRPAGSPEAAFVTLAGCPSDPAPLGQPSQLEPTPLVSGAVDWNCNAVADGVVAADINDDGQRTASTSINDWEALAYDGGAIAEPGGSVTLPATSEMIEPQLDELLRNEQALEGPLRALPAAPAVTPQAQAPAKKKCKKGRKLVKGKCRKKKKRKK